MAAGGTASPPTEAMRRGISRGVFVVTVVVVAIIALTGGFYVGKGTSSSSSSSASHYLVVGTNVPFPPFESFNNSSGAYVGFDMNFSQLIANALGRTLVIDNYANFAVLLADVGAGVVDMAASAITESGSVGAARNSSMSFSLPYYDANQAILVASSSKLTCPTVAQGGCTVSNLSSLKLGVQTGTSSQSWLQQYVDGTPSNETNGGQVFAFTTVDLEIDALLTGSLQAVMIDLGPATSIAASSGGALKVAGEVLTNELYGFAVAHGDPEHILPVINSVITTSEQNGTYANLVKEWFGSA
ncbi:MAG: ABC transporter substrate-binding protein [Thermoplasmata archaeon]